MGVMKATDQVTIVEGGIGDTTELEAKVEELNNNLSNKLKYYITINRSTDANGCLWIGTQGDDGAIPISAIWLGDGWKECTITSYSSNNIKNFGARIRNHDGSFYANQTNVTVGVVWANPTVYNL